MIIAQPENHEITRGFHNVAKAVYHMYDFFVQLKVIHRAGGNRTLEWCTMLVQKPLRYSEVSDWMGVSPGR